MKTDDTKQRALLERGLSDLNINPEHLEKINTYLNELLKWNKVYNLSGFKNLEDHIYRNILDCLAVAPFIKAKSMMDLGTGAGLPGLLLAILDPNQQWTLLDGNGKKTRFLSQQKQLLGLDNVQVEHARVEQYQNEARFDGISSRAFDKIPDSLNLCQHLFRPKAQLFALKGKVLEEDIQDLPSWAKINEIHAIEVPGINEERHLITVDIQLDT